MLNEEDYILLKALLLVYLDEDGSYEANLKMTASDILDDIDSILHPKDYEW